MSYRVWINGGGDREFLIECETTPDLLALIDGMDGPVRVERVGGLYRSTVPAVTATLFQRWCENRAAEANDFFMLSTSGCVRRLARRAYDTLHQLAKGD